jgi:Uma2 family endonuclease
VKVRYPDVVVVDCSLDQTTRTLTDAVAIFEVLSDDAVTTDRVEKLIDYVGIPSLRSYMLLEQTAVAATQFQLEPGGAWIAGAHTAGAAIVPGLDITPETDRALPGVDLFSLEHFDRDRNRHGRSGSVPQPGKTCAARSSEK